MRNARQEVNSSGKMASHTSVPYPPPLPESKDRLLNIKPEKTRMKVECPFQSSLFRPNTLYDTVTVRTSGQGKSAILWSQLETNFSGS